MGAEVDDCGLKFSDDLSTADNEFSESEISSPRTRNVSPGHVQHQQALLKNQAQASAKPAASAKDDSEDNDAYEVLLGRSFGGFRQNRYWIRPTHLRND